MSVFLENGARIQDGAIKDANDFWQLVQDVGYIIEGESRAFEREYMHWLAERLTAWLDEHPEITIDGPPDHFAMVSVARLAHAFVFNDGGATEAEAQRAADDSKLPF